MKTRFLSLRHRLSGHWRAFQRAERGIAAIEAALLIPLMAFTIVGFIELYQYHRAVALLDRTAFTLANGISMQRDLYNRSNCTESNNICTYGAIAGDLMQPLNYNRNGQVIFSVYATETSGRRVTWKTRPEWSIRYQGHPDTFNVPSADSRLDRDQFPNANANDTLIVVEMFYEHQPFVLSAAFWDTLGGQRQMYTRAYFRPRFSDIRDLG